MLSGLHAQALEGLAQALSLVRHEDGHRLLHDEIPDRNTPLRILAHGRAAWDPAHSTEHTGAWMLMSGSVLGLGAVNDWALGAGYERTWPREHLATIRCRAKGPVWTLELAPERFAEVFMSDTGAALRTRLLAMFPTITHGPEVVAALRRTAQFSRINASSLYRLLEYAPTQTYYPAGQHDAKQVVFEQQVLEQQLFDANSIAHGLALYYVLRGELRVIDEDAQLLLSARTIGGPDLFSDRFGGAYAKMPPAPTATIETHAVVVTKHALTKMMRSTPGFTRRLGPLVQGQRVS